MNEVSAQTAALLLDALVHRGVDGSSLWAGLPVTLAQVQARRGRISWETWVEMMARAEQACGVDQTEQLFVAGAGARTGHQFVQLANAFLSVRDVYALLARWGLSRHLRVITARFEPRGDDTARFTLTIDPSRVGSLPTLRFVVGVLRNLPGLQGLPLATVRIDPEATPHHARYDVVMPRDQTLFSRARRVLRVAAGAAAALDELEQQAAEIVAKNVALEQQLAETERAVTALREREEWLELALDAGRVGIWRSDPSTGRVRLSEGLGQLLGLPGQGEIATAAWTERIHPDDRDRVAGAIRVAVERGEPFEAEYRIFRPSGELGWIHVKGRVVSDRASGRSHVFGTVADLTDKKLVETKLRFADRLIAAGTLAAGVAHEINNPLTYVLGNVELIRRRLRDVPAVEPLLRESLAHILDGLERIRGVVADLRAFARPEEDVGARTELRVVCDAAIRIVSSLVRHRASVTTEYADDTPAVIANESRLGQVIVNLIINASHAMPDRPAADNQIVVRTRRLPTGEVAIEVEDNGTGISPDVLPRLFDPFFTTKPIGDGTGLGLSVCQSIVASLHGRIEVDTTQGAGTTFSVVLPAAPPVAGVSEPVVHPTPIAAGQRVLVIDDEPLLRSVLATMLSTQGYVVVEAESSRAGVALASSGPPFDAVLCDLMMPDLDGPGVHAELSRLRPDVVRRLLFITGGAVTARTRAFVERSDIVLLAKPFTIEQVSDVLARVGRRSE